MKWFLGQKVEYLRILTLFNTYIEHIFWDPGSLAHRGGSSMAFISLVCSVHMLFSNTTPPSAAKYSDSRSKPCCLWGKNSLPLGGRHTPLLCYTCASVKLLLWTHLFNISFLLLSIIQPGGHLWKPLHPIPANNINLNLLQTGLSLKTRPSLHMALTLPK